MPDFEHFILTRFNVRERPNDTQLVTNPQWLNHRIILFEQFCFPSVKAQTCTNFRWLVFFDEATPDEFKDRFQAYHRDFPNFEPIYITEHNPDTVAQAVRQRLAPDTPFVITTRLDNDDALCRDFIERVQAEFRHQEAEIINFPFGYIWFKGRLYLYRDPSNPFTTLIEKAEPLRTIVARPHRKLAELAPIRQAGITPAWLQVVHSSNKRNRLRGKRTRPAEFERQFPVGTHTFCRAPGRLSFYVDRLLLDHLRNGREILIQAIKRMSLH
ncbi:MAG: glycosyltransferase [Candidatus Hydrogenedentales bacterium]